MRHTPSQSFSDAVPFVQVRTIAPAAHGANLLGRLLWILGLPRRMVATRREMALLGSMSARDLADIGLSRQDVQDAASLPFGTAPWSLLTRRAHERRRAALGHRR